MPASKRPTPHLRVPQIGPTRVPPGLTPGARIAVTSLNRARLCARLPGGEESHVYRHGRRDASRWSLRRGATRSRTYALTHQAAGTALAHCGAHRRRCRTYKGSDRGHANLNWQSAVDIVDAFHKGVRIFKQPRLGTEIMLAEL